MPRIPVRHKEHGANRRSCRADGTEYYQTESQDKSLAKNDVKHANRVIANSKKAVTSGASIVKKNRKNADPYISGTEMRSIIESLKRISEYSADIAEVSINMSVKELRNI